MIEATALPAIAHGVLDRCFGRAWRSAVIEPIVGTTNFVARLELPAGRFALRVPRLDDEVTQVDRRSECLVLRAAARGRVAPEVVACDGVSGVLITRWIDGVVWTLARAREYAAIASVARLLRGLHSLAVPTGARDIDLERLIDRYLEQIRGMQAEPVSWCRRRRDTALLRLAAAPRAGAALCHCDVHHRNILESNHLQLIDWEYAGRADAMFDLASYAGYHDLDIAQTRELLGSYGAAGEAARQFGDWRWLFEYIWLLWTLVTSAPAPNPAASELISRLHAKLLAHE